jgi:hypothetical protein
MKQALHSPTFIELFAVSRFGTEGAAVRYYRD